jgi:hypothetical protein
MSLKDEVKIPVWLVTLLISAFFTMEFMLFTNINSRLDRIETKLDNHITIKTEYAKK